MGNSLHLQICHVTRRFKVNGEALTALDDVSLDVAEGEFVTITPSEVCVARGFDQLRSPNQAKQVVIAGHQVSQWFCEATL